MSSILHVDMDAFYASVELRSRPELHGRPVIVGGAGRGVVLSATYQARAAGVTSGMPSSRARRLCPDAVFLAPDFRSYGEVSTAIVAVFDSVTSVVEAVSIDEAYLDVTGARRRLGTPRAIAEHIRALVTDEQQITCSVGIGPTKFVAKMASRAAKPDGVVEVAPDEVAEFLHPLPVEAMWGIGRPTAAKLHRLGLATVGDLAAAPAGLLRRAFGPHAGRLLTELAWGRDPRPVSPSTGERSVGSQETFSADTDDPATIRRELLRMAARTASRTRKAGLLGRTVTISIRFADFTTISRSATMSSPTDVTGEIHAEAVRLYEQLTGRGQPGADGRAVRRVGVRLESLVPRDRGWQQPELTAPEYGWHEAERAVDRAVSRFGPAAVQRASLATGSVGPGRGTVRQMSRSHPSQEGD